MRHRVTPSAWLRAALVVIVAAIAPAPVAQTRPNVVVILVDDMGWSDIGLLRQRDLDAEPRCARGARRTFHAVLQHASLLADAGQSAHRALPASGWDGASGQRHPRRVHRAPPDDSTIDR